MPVVLSAATAALLLCAGGSAQTFYAPSPPGYLSTSGSTLAPVLGTPPTNGSSASTATSGTPCW